MTDIKIHVEHLTRVEGHGNIVLNTRNGAIEQVQWQVSEAPRFFESFVRGRPYHQLSHITSRICGICSIGHALASLKATEAAFGVALSAQTQLLRRLATHAENLQSHILHVGYLVAPDLLGVGSVVPLVQSHPDAVRTIVRLHRLANEMSDLLCGRTTHPISLVVGGFSAIPTARQLAEIRQKLLDSVPAAANIAQLVLDHAGALPAFARETEYIALVADTEYAIYDGIIGSTDTGRYAVADYESIVNEFVVPHSTAKFARHHRDSYMVGALARFNLNSRLLRPLARDWAERFGLRPVCHNPFMNSVAQMVEFLHSLEDAVVLLDDLLRAGPDVAEPPSKVRVKAARGIGAVDVPRGLLIHDYTYDEDGRCVRANCVIPTNQNHNNINRDLAAFAPTLLKRPETEIERNLEMLVRAYDPCISCSTHYLTVRFVE
jgi:coenzyme F420-reducing hydrogenase alpha subunit